MKQDIISAIEKLQEQTNRYELKTLDERLSDISKNTEEFKLRVLFVGGFSAGKSALINTLIGRDLLEEDQTPETAIASEVIYDTNEYIEAVSEDGIDKYVIDEINEIDTKKYEYLIWHLNVDSLKKLGNTIIVDMPGFNSGISNHNKAILRYAGQGNAYVLVIDCAEGTIKQNITDFIKEIKNYNNNLSVAVTKTDLMTSSDVEKVKISIRRNAEMSFGDDIEIFTTSKYDEEAATKIVNIVNAYDQDAIFTQVFNGEVYEVAVKCLDSLQVYKKSLSLSLTDFDDEIEKHEKSKSELIKRLDSEKVKLEKRFRDNVVPSIMVDVHNALYAQAENLANSLKAGEQSFSMTVNNILRPVLTSSTNQYVEQSFGKFISELDLSSIDNSALKEVSVNALDKYQQANSKIQEIAKNGQNLNAAYKAITTALALTTSVVAPWLELILIFLPDILTLFSNKKQDNDLVNKINNEIIPQIEIKMKPEIEKSLMDMKEEMIQQVESEINSLINSEIEAITRAEESKNAEIEDHESKVADIDADIEVVKSIIEKLEEE